MKQHAKRFAIFLSFLFAAGGVSACGKSLYGSVSKKDNFDSKLEDALVAIDDNNFGKSTKILNSLWEKKKTDEIAQLLVISKLAEVNLDVFSIVKDALLASSNTNQNSLASDSSNSDVAKAMLAANNGREGGKSGTDIMDSLMEVLPEVIDDNVMSVLKESTSILGQAPTKAVVKPLTCFVGGIYVGVMTNSLNTAFITLTVSLKSDVEKLGNTCTGPEADQLTTSLDASLARLNGITETLPTLSNIVSECLGSSNTSNKIQKRLDKIYATADKGCSIPSQTIGGITFPTCANSIITNAGNGNSKAGDKKIDGCELFVNCLGNAKGCF